MTEYIFDDVTQDFELDLPFRGSIRCRNIVVKSSGSLIGHIEAVSVRNFGKIMGSINASGLFINNEGAHISGNVFAPEIGIHPKSSVEGSFSKTHRFSFDEEPLDVSLRYIEDAVERGIARYKREQDALKASTPVQSRDDDSDLDLPIASLQQQVGENVVDDVITEDHIARLKNMMAGGEPGHIIFNEPDDISVDEPADIEDNNSIEPELIDGQATEKFKNDEEPIFRDIPLLYT